MSDETMQPVKNRRRLWLVLAALLALLMLAVIPPYLNINRYRHRVASDISRALGRPVRIDNVGFRILPTPGFTIENFVVGEDPAFGSEPFLRANTVTATLHASSLWQRRLEFATISLDEPSVNIVRNASGRWNVESIVMQASQSSKQINAAPTDAPHTSGLPRFPYIEATQARVNIKMGEEKMPFSLTEAKFAFWLSQPESWHVRMEARPLRTDMNASDTGLVQVEGTFQRATTLDAIPLSLTATWHKAQLGDVSHMILGENAGWRGTLEAEAHVNGHFSDAQVDAKVHVDDVRRADFVPERSLALDLACTANARNNLHAYTGIHCAVPVGDGHVILDGSVPDLRRAMQPTLHVTAQQVPAAEILEFARHATNRIAPEVAAEGTLDGSFSYDAAPQPVMKHAASAQMWQSAFTLPLLTLHVPGIDDPVKVTGLHLHTVDGAKRRPGMGAVLDPATITLGGTAPATLDGALRCNSYTLHLRGGVNELQVRALAKAIPQFGDGIDDVLPATTGVAPVAIDATTERHWSGLGIYAGANATQQDGGHWTTSHGSRAGHSRR